ncbi:hypothetical protein NDU88_001220 [Pleurodeles waltl]|uniref:Secreted protein n=1 Tax=Pleurodeles waltl TaxID=8319 RepID=A0AAV7UTG6_PLEWA|nr:hypothetical protein NDU88_001220 [Pleurodeles waltl]
MKGLAVCLGVGAVRASSCSERDLTGQGLPPPLGTWGTEPAPGQSAGPANDTGERRLARNKSERKADRSQILPAAAIPVRWKTYTHPPNTSRHPGRQTQYRHTCARPAKKEHF